VFFLSFHFFRPFSPSAQEMLVNAFENTPFDLSDRRQAVLESDWPDSPSVTFLL